MVSSNQDLITLFQKRQVDYLVRFCNADLLAAVDAVVEEMEDFYTSGEMVEDDYALSREEFYAKMPVHRRVDGKLLIKKLKENNELVEQAISAVVIDHFINLVLHSLRQKRLNGIIFDFLAFQSNFVSFSY